MTEPINVPVDDEASDEPTPVPPTRVARIWKKQPPNSGSLGTSLKAMDVLYDAGEPLTREELEARLVTRLDRYECEYLKAWYARELEKSRKRRGETDILEESDPSSNIAVALHRWITAVFLTRVRTSHTLVRTPDGKLQPGREAPRIARADGRVLPYTPETRQQFAEEDREKQRLYHAELEWADLMQVLPLPTQAARAQLLTLLIRRLLVGFKSEGHKMPLDERLISPKLNRLISLANTPTLQKAVLQRALDALWDEKR